MRSRPSFFRRPGCLIALGMLAAVVYGLSMLWDAIKPGCRGGVLDRLPSPDGALIAVTDEFICDVGFLPSTVTPAGVDLVTTKPPFRDTRLLVVDTGGYADQRPSVAWAAPNVLRITVPLHSLLHILTRQAGGVRVDIHFDPDDPAARAAWLKQTNQSPDPPEDSKSP
jgi:hypothetical protein